MKPKVIGTAEEVKKLLKTNREYKQGSYVKGSEEMLKKMALGYPSLFEFEGAKPKPEPKKSKKEHKPSKNKLFSKGDKFKSKGE